MESKLHDTYRAIEQDHWWFVGRRKILLNVLEKYLGNKSSILDVGCNTGVLVDILQKKGYNASGTDISKEAIIHGKTRGVRNLFVAEANREPFANNTFDCVLALDVLEHIDNDKEALREWKRLLKPGGLLVIKVPAYMWLWGIQDAMAHHKRRYTAGSLLDVVGLHYTSILRVSYFNFILFIPIALSRFAQKWFYPKRTSDFDLNNAFINTIFTSIFLFEAKLLKFVNFPFGVSLLLIARKT